MRNSGTNRAWYGGLLAAAVWAGALAAWMVPAVPALAQSDEDEEEDDELARWGDNWDYSGNETVLKRDAEMLATLIGADAATREAIVGVQQAYEQRLRADGRKLARYQQQLQKAAEGEGWTEELTTKNQTAWTKFNERKTKLREQVLGDMKLMLTDEQVAQQWPKFESRIQRRRALSELGGWSVSGINADVSGIIENVFKDSGLPETVSTVLVDYERELELKLADVKKQMDALNEAQPSPEVMQDDDARQRYFREQQYERYKTAKVVRDYHLRTIERIIESLPEADSARVERAFYREAFNERYGWLGNRETSLDDGLDRIGMLKDLTPEQKQEIEAIRIEADAELGGSTKSMALAMMDAEERQMKRQADGETESFYDPELWQEVQTQMMDRIRAEQKYIERLRQVLTAEQRNKAGKPFNVNPGSMPRLEFED